MYEKGKEGRVWVPVDCLEMLLAVEGVEPPRRSLQVTEHTDYSEDLLRVVLSFCFHDNLGKIGRLQHTFAFHCKVLEGDRVSQRLR